jgi:hypothetical protein
MFNFRVAGIAGGAAFVLSFLVGLVSGAGILVVLLRAVIFAVLFFGASCGIHFVVQTFLPELLSSTGEASVGDILDGAPGSRVNVTVGEAIQGAFPTGDFDEVDNIDGKKRAPDPGSVSVAGLSGLSDADGGFESAMPTLSAPPLETPSQPLPKAAPLPKETPLPGAPLEKSGGAGYTETKGPPEVADLMPDIDALGEAFLPQAGGAAESEPVYDTPVQTISPSSKGSGLKGDFNPKELAQAIQTVLKKDEKG